MISPEAIVDVTHFTVIDLDHNGTPEIVLSVDVYGNSYGVVILSYQDGDVYGYVFSDRAFSDLKTDGTYWFSAGASDSGFGLMTLSKDTAETEKLHIAKVVRNILVFRSL